MATEELSRVSTNSRRSSAVVGAGHRFATPGRGIDTRLPPQARPGGVSPSGAKRRDIQGLRAIAVALVVANHLSGWPRGGFVGVDVFFVISGYLITGLLVRDLGSERTVAHRLRSLRNFYWRRVTRLLPASLTVTVATLIGAHALFGTTRFQDTVHDAWWATGFAANVRFADVGTNYFAANRAVSPLQHYWSLSVEEQFYLAWPLGLLIFSVLISALLRGIRPGADPRRLLILVPAVVAVGSFLWSLQQTDHSPSAAYFSTTARAWELGLGAVVACGQRFVPMPRTVASVLSWCGLATVIVSAFVATGSGVPAPGVLVPCLGAALCLACVSSDGAPVRNAVLTNRLAVRLGDISYSVYLVHFPIIILLGTRLPAHSTPLYFSAILLTLGSATLLHQVVETPGMALGKRTARRDPARRTAKALRELGHHSRPVGPARKAVTALDGVLRRAAIGAAVILLGLAALTVSTANAARQTQRFDLVQSALRLPAPGGATVGPQTLALAEAIRTALRARAWPTLTPSFDAESKRLQVPGSLLGCGAIVLQSDARCTFGPASAKHTMYVVGDSTAMAYTEGYRRILAELPGWKLRVSAAYGCEFSSIVLANSDAAVEAGCAQHDAAVVRDIDATKPDVLLVTNTYTSRTSRATGKVLSEPEWDSAVAAELATVPSTTRISIVEPAPISLDPYSCYQPGSTPIDCVTHIPSAHQSRGLAEQRLATEHGWTFVPTEYWFCDAASGYCPEFADGVPIRHDSLHITYAYDDAIAAAMFESLEHAGVFR